MGLNIVRCREDVPTVRITETQFLEAFAEVWFAALDAGRVPSSGPYGNREAWKEFIEGEEGLLAQVLERLAKGGHFWYGREVVFRFDAAYGDDPDRRHPVVFAAFIEHELNNDPETEMQKLILTRAPLKVLLFYDWGEFEKDTALRRQWADSKLAWFAAALEKANAACPEDERTAYIFCIGRRATPDAEIKWYAASSKPLQPILASGLRSLARPTER